GEVFSRRAGRPDDLRRTGKLGMEATRHRGDEEGRDVDGLDAHIGRLVVVFEVALRRPAVLDDEAEAGPRARACGAPRAGRSQRPRAARAGGGVRAPAFPPPPGSLCRLTCPRSSWP